MRTWPEVKINLIDVTAKSDSTPQTSDNVSFGDIALLKGDETPDYTGLDNNEFILDGSKSILEDAGNVLFRSAATSKTDCSFTTSPGIKITFTKPHTSAGIEILFSGDYPEEVKAIWKSAAVQKEITYHPDSLRAFLEAGVDNYTEITLEFVKTRFPGQSVRINGIRYGLTWEIGRDNIRKASVLEETDVTSETLPINTATLEVVDEKNEFDLTRKSGMWKNMQKGQKAEILEYVNGQYINCGTFYLDTWDSENNIVKLSLVDRLGIADKTDFYQGRIYVKEKAGVILEEILESAGIEEYSISDEVYNVLLSGWLGIQKHREALQQVVFAAGAVADCSRSSAVRIYKPGRYAGKTIGLDRKFRGAKVKLDEYISGVSISYRQYTLSAEKEEAGTVQLIPGENRVEFTEPYKPDTLEASAGTIKEAKTNYIVITATEGAECTISGKKYTATKNVYTQKAAEEAGETEKIQSYDGCTLISADRVKDLAESLLRYKKLRQTLQLRYICQGEAAGEWCNIANTAGRYATTGIIRQTLDLTGGFLASATCRGYSEVMTEEVYCGESYTGGGLI